MKIGILSDIHSNLEALEVVLRGMDTERVERVYCLGDIVGYGASPNECLDHIRRIVHSCVIGNHDDAVIGRTASQYFNPYARAAVEWTARVLTEENLEFLKALPFTFAEEHLLMVHATPSDPPGWNYVIRAEDAEPHFRAMPVNTTAFIGHSHIPARFEDRETGKVILNVGSVGQPRDRDPRTSWMLYDTDSREAKWQREIYPVQEAARKIRQANLPEYLAARLFVGM